jgi:hypothetical protein
MSDQFSIIGFQLPKITDPTTYTYLSTPFKRLGFLYIPNLHPYRISLPHYNAPLHLSHRVAAPLPLLLPAPLSSSQCILTFSPFTAYCPSDYRLAPPQSIGPLCPFIDTLPKAQPDQLTYGDCQFGIKNRLPTPPQIDCRL